MMIEQSIFIARTLCMRPASEGRGSPGSRMFNAANSGGLPSSAAQGMALIQARITHLGRSFSVVLTGLPKS